MLNAYFQLIPFEEDKPTTNFDKEEKEERKKSKKKKKLIDEKEQINLKEELVQDHNSYSDFSSISSDEEGAQAERYKHEPDKQFNEVKMEVIMKALQQQHKSQEEVRLLQNALIHNPFFMKIKRQINETLYLELFQEIQLERFRAYDTIFNIGDEGNNFYIILSGEVLILVPKIDSTSNLSQQSSVGQLTPAVSSASILSNSNNIENTLQNQRKSSFLKSPAPPNTKSNESLFKMAISKNMRLSLKQGDPIPLVLKSQEQQQQPAKLLFDNQSASSPKSKQEINIPEQSYLGPIGMFQNKYQDFSIIRKMGAGESFGEIAAKMNNKRTASVACKKDSEMAVLSKKAFDKILGEFFQNQWEEKHNFIKKISLFKDYRKGFITNVIMNLRKKTYHYNDIIYEEGSEKMRLFLIRNGEVELSKKAIFDPKQIGANWTVNNTSVSQSIVLSSKSAYDIFGEVEILQNIPRFTRARCKSTKLEVFSISQVKLMTNLNNEEFLSDLKKSSNMIHQWRDQHYKEMIKQIYDKRDPLNKTFRNPQIGRALVEQKFREEFMKQDPGSIEFVNKPVFTEMTAKKAYFSKVQNYVAKITDVIGAISQFKEQQTGIKLPKVTSIAKIRSKTTSSKRKEVPSLPRISLSSSSSQIQRQRQSQSFAGREQSFSQSSFLMSPHNFSQHSNPSKRRPSPFNNQSQNFPHYIKNQFSLPLSRQGNSSLIFPPSSSNTSAIQNSFINNSSNLQSSRINSGKTQSSQNRVVFSSMPDIASIMQFRQGSSSSNISPSLDENKSYIRNINHMKDINGSLPSLPPCPVKLTLPIKKLPSRVLEDLKEDMMQTNENLKEIKTSGKLKIIEDKNQQQKDSVIENDISITQGIDHQSKRNESDSNALPSILSSNQISLLQGESDFVLQSNEILDTEIGMHVPHKYKKIQQGTETMETNSINNSRNSSINNKKDNEFASFVHLPLIKSFKPKVVPSLNLKISNSIKMSSSNLHQQPNTPIYFDNNKNNLSQSSANQLKMEDASTFMLNLSSLHSLQSPTSSKDSSTIKISSKEPSFLSKIYEKISQENRYSCKGIKFNEKMNRKMVEEGLARHSRSQHQPKVRIEDFSNLNKIREQINSFKFKEVREKAQKMNMIKKLNLDSILQYKYATPQPRDKKENIFADFQCFPRSTSTKHSRSKIKSGNLQRSKSPTALPANRDQSVQSPSVFSKIEPTIKNKKQQFV